MSTGVTILLAIELISHLFEDTVLEFAMSHSLRRYSVYFAECFRSECNTQAYLHDQEVMVPIVT